MKTHPVAQNHRRQWLATAATLGVAPWLLSACAQTASAPRPTTDQPASAARRRLGPLEVFPIGLGVQWHPSGPQGVVDLYQSRTTRQGGVALIRRAADLCINFFDTAEVYGPFMSEELLGEALQGSRRDRAVISTKFGFDVDPTTGQRRGGVTIVDLIPQHQSEQHAKQQRNPSDEPDKFIGSKRSRPSFHDRSLHPRKRRRRQCEQ